MCAMSDGMRTISQGDKVAVRARVFHVKCCLQGTCQNGRISKITVYDTNKQKRLKQITYNNKIKRKDQVYNPISCPVQFIREFTQRRRRRLRKRHLKSEFALPQT